MARSLPDSMRWQVEKSLRRRRILASLALVLLALVAVGCYNYKTGESHIGDSINFTLPAFPETGGNAVQVFTEMHYQPSFRTQEGPRLLPPLDSVPVTGREVRYTSLEEYKGLTVPQKDYDTEAAQHLIDINCTVCHGTGLRGDGPIVPFMDIGPFPADLTLALTKDSTDGELFGFISDGGRQGQAARINGLVSRSPMPEFRRLLTEDERWALVQFLRLQIGR